ncbi:MAG TPA: NAD(P)-binding protein [Actinomycetota bacterium]|nr:NAD(P)-binding protein [Actinomycetota bacterium]
MTVDLKRSAKGDSTIIETDYLVVGAGASGMAFTDSLIAHSDADVVLIDRRHRAGGHWNDDYPFVRLHQPSAYYGVDSRALGTDRIDQNGANAGFYERATGAEICDYYARVLEQNLVPSGRVRFRGMHEYVGETAGEHQITSLLTGETTAIRVRRKLVDATYIATTIPSMHKPTFSADPGARVIAPNELVDLADPGSGFTVMGAGKTSMDTCCWLIEQGVTPQSIRWIRPRDPYTVDRSWMQPLGLMGSLIEWLALQTEAASEATDATDLVHRLEASRVLQRLDPDVEPSVYRGATLSEQELATLRSIDNVVRLGRLLHVGLDTIELDRGTINTDPKHVHIDCTAPGLGTPPTRPIFEQGRITIQRVQAGIDPFSAALIGRVEATGRGDEDMNRLCPANDMRGEATAFAPAMLVTLLARTAWMGDPELREWFTATRLNPLHDAARYMNDASRASAQRLIQSNLPAIENLQRMLARG